MDILKLNDNLPEDTGKPVLKITNIKQAVKNENRVNVFVNGKYSFSLDIAQLADIKLKNGQVITEEELAEFKKASEFGKLYQRTLEWVLTRPHSIRETKDYLYRRVRNMSRGSKTRPSGSERSRETIPDSFLDYSSFTDAVVERLLSKGYLDDLKFAEYYVENRFVKKGISKKRLKMELMKKGVSNETIEEVLNKTSRNDEEEILKIIAKKRSKYDDEKLIQYLCRQGFHFETVRNLVQTYGMDSRNSE